MEIFNWFGNNKDNLQGIQFVFQAIQSVIIIITAIIGLRWYYIRRRKYPKLLLDQEITHVELDNGKIFIRVKIKLENKGETLIKIKDGFARLQQIKPLVTNPEIAEPIERGEEPIPANYTKIPWPLLKDRFFAGDSSYRELEPGETDELIVDYIVGNYLETVLSFVSLDNPARKRDKDKIGWHKSTIYTITKQTVAQTQTI